MDVPKEAFAVIELPQDDLFEEALIEEEKSSDQRSYEVDLYLRFDIDGEE